MKDKKIHMLDCLNILWLQNQMKQLYFHAFALLAIQNEHPCLSAGGGGGGVYTLVSWHAGLDAWIPD